ncbi:SGNH/GDSL hydrolase family protein [Aetokthonos hydrillicola]|uniref:SGNH/GDSL hydrolase family protein n=1 Tax=Aetokthonos hydrillicola TaxID=1550245 RepID=UPI003B75CB27
MRLAEHLKDEYSVFNRSIPGITSTQALERLPSELASVNPSVCILATSLVNEKIYDTAPFYICARYLKTVESIRALCANANCELLVASQLPCNLYSELAASAIDAAHKALSTQSLLLSDWWTDTQAPGTPGHWREGYSISDGIHPNDDGHSYLYDKIPGGILQSRTSSKNESSNKARLLWGLEQWISVEDNRSLTFDLSKPMYSFTAVVRSPINSSRFSIALPTLRLEVQLTEEGVFIGFGNEERTIRANQAPGFTLSVDMESQSGIVSLLATPACDYSSVQFEIPRTQTSKLIFVSRSTASLPWLQEVCVYRNCVLAPLGNLEYRALSSDEVGLEIGLRPDAKSGPWPSVYGVGRGIATLGRG